MMWAGPHALDDTMQEMRIAAAQLTDDEFLALMPAIKDRWHSTRKLRDADLGRGDDEQPTAE